MRIKISPKNLILILFVSATLLLGWTFSAWAVINTFPHTEDFDSCILPDPPTDWSYTGFTTVTTSSRSSPNSARCDVGEPEYTDFIISEVVYLTMREDVSLSFWYRATSTADTAQIEVDASLDGGSTYTVTVISGFVVTADSTYHEVSALDITALNDQSNVKFRWKVGYDTGGNINIDDITFDSTGPDLIPPTMLSAMANNASGGGPGIDPGDQVVITFSEPMDPLEINEANINNALPIDGKLTGWWDGSENIEGASWSGGDMVLTITLSTTDGTPLVVVDDIINPPGSGYLTDLADNPLSGTQTISGSFDPPVVTVVINEIAWGGTAASGGSYDEWIELYNTTGSPVDIANWSIYGAKTGSILNFSDADGSISTTIPAGGYLIYANGDDDVKLGGTSLVVDIWDATIGMSNTSPGQVILYDAPSGGGNVIDIANQPSGTWCAGTASPSYKTMERINPFISGTECSNWADCTTSGPETGSDDITLINGTPKRENSVTFYVKSAQTMDSSHNGQIDHYKLTFNEAVRDNRIDGYIEDSIGNPSTTFFVAGHSTVRLAHGTVAPEPDIPNDDTIYFQINEISSYDTGKKPDITTDSATIRDNATDSKSLSNVGTGDVREEDGAPPVPVTVISDTLLGGDNNLQSGTKLTITFSEIINVTGVDDVDDADFVTTPVAWPDGATVVYADDVVGDEKMIATLDPGTTIPGSWTYDATFNRSPVVLVNSGSIKDTATVPNDAVKNKAENPLILGLAEAPSATSIISIVQATDGSGYLEFRTTISDTEHQPAQLKVEFSKDGGSHWYDPYLHSVSGSGPVNPPDNSLEYQVRDIDTSSPNTLTVVWDTKSSENEGGFLNLDRPDIMLRVTPRDDYAIGSLVTSFPPFSLDNLPPIPLANLRPQTVTSSSITWEWDPSTIESHFNHYELWYGKDLTKVESRDATPPDGATEWTETNMAISSKTITGLSSNATYYAKIWAIDDLNNEISAPYNFVATESPSEKKSESEKWGCFIATSAYIPVEPVYQSNQSHLLTGRQADRQTGRQKLDTLRQFRDEWLFTNPLGKAFVRFYYQYSPRIADFIRDKESLKAIVRRELRPLVWIVKKIL